MKAIVFAGDPSASQDDQITAPSFLRLEGRPLLLYVLVALDSVAAVDEIEVFGPQQQIMKVLEGALPHFLFSKTIRVQSRNVKPENLFFSAERSDKNESDDPLNVLSARPYILLLPGNIPLVTSGEIKAFLSAADLSNHDLALGLSAESQGPALGSLGSGAAARKAFCHLIDGTFRTNNMALLRPFGITEQFEFRGQKEKIEKKILTSDGDAWGGTLSIDFKALLPCLLASHWRKINELAGLGLSLEELEEEAHKYLNIKAKLVKTKIGYASLHINNTSELKALEARMNDWREDLLRLSNKDENECPLAGESY